ncbi:hypothetical protein F0562_014388 [Nyssa sinensis]|uniref:LYK3/RLK10-like LysM domain-containing protein n=1 Tax=Nyssa sinensis TaxID=561372 RepID=A0A5J4ZRS1_9ASTE|nr:hypothetical protein F0562_014388 [Nyssa sinensis]
MFSSSSVGKLKLSAELVVNSPWLHTTSGKVQTSLTSAAYSARKSPKSSNTIPTFRIKIAFSADYGLFATYPLRPGENLSSVAMESGVQAELLQRFNPGSDFGAGTGPGVCAG